MMSLTLLNVLLVVGALFIDNGNGFILRNVRSACGYNPADIVFVLDESGSIWNPDFKTQIQFVKDIIEIFDVSQNVTHIGTMTYADDTKVYFNLGQHTSHQSLYAALDQIQQRRGQTYTHDALRRMRLEMFSSRYSRKWVPRMAIVITDGESDDPPLTAEEARLAKEDGITIFAIGVGDATNKQELEAIGSSPSSEYVFRVESYNALDKLKNILAKKACEETTVPPPTTTTTTTTTTVPTTTLPQGITGCTARSPMDVIFALPDQTGIRDTELSLNFISSVMDLTEMSPFQVQGSLTPRYCDRSDGIRLRDNDNIQGFQISLEERELVNTRTNLHIQYIRTTGISDANGGRPDSAKFGVLIIDNKSRNADKTMQEALLAKEQGIELIVVGVGDYIDKEELDILASSKESLFYVDTYDELTELSESLVHRMCEVLGGRMP